MKKYYIIFIGIVSNISLTFAQNTFIKTFSNGTGDLGKSIIQTSDSSYLIAARNYYSGAMNPYELIYLIKTNLNGDTIWSFKDDDTINVKFCPSVLESFDHNYIAAGYYADSVDENMLLIKLDQSGDTIWSNAYGNSFDNWANSVEQTSDSGYILAGATMNSISYNHDSIDIFIVKTNSNGQLIWSKDIGSNQYDEAQRIKQTFDGGFMVCGSTGFGNNSNIFLLKLAANGDTLWSKIYGDLTLGEYDLDMIQTLDSGFVLAGYQGDDFYILRTNQLGDTLWTKKYETDKIDMLASIIELSDNDFIVAGHCQDTSFANSYGFIMRIDQNGDTIWTNFFDNSFLYSGIKTNESQYCFVGRSFNPASILFLKTDSLGKTGCYEQVVPLNIEGTNTSINYVSLSVINTGSMTNPVIKRSRNINQNLICSTQAVNEVTDDRIISLTNNPAISFIDVNGTNSSGHLSIYTIDGKFIHSYNCQNLSTTISIDYLKSGYYILNYWENKINTNLKLIKILEK